MTPIPRVVRDERPMDRLGVRLVNEAAFGRADEADLVETLHAEAVVLCALVAEAEGRVVGHALFSRMRIETGETAIDAVALAPVAVAPGHQRQGIGGQLIRHGIEALRAAGERIVLVLGHPDYYRRFGFSTEGARGLDSPFPREAYMALDLVPDALSGVSGRVVYARAFGL